VIKHPKPNSGQRKADTLLPVSQPDELLKFLLQSLPGSRNGIKSLLAHRQILVDGRVTTRHDQPLQPGQMVCVRWSLVRDSGRKWEITPIFTDPWLMVIEKPAGLLSIASDQEKENTAYRMATALVRQDDEDSRMFIVHRLDRETSGLMMLARDEATKHKLQDNWRDIMIDRAYLAVVEGHLDEPEGRIVSWLKETATHLVYPAGRAGEGQEAITNYRVLQTGPRYSLVELRLETGRKHQIRVHMQSLGHPVVGDKKYGGRDNPLGRLALHAHVLAFRHPVSGEEMRFETAAPQPFIRLLSR
jgi:23S rRNA pseudouridine1911/1915/1917 synthase